MIYVTLIIKTKIDGDGLPKPVLPVSYCSNLGLTIIYFGKLKQGGDDADGIDNGERPGNQRKALHTSKV